MPTPLAEHWKHEVDGQAEPGPWRNAATDPPPAPPTAVFWLERRAGMADGEYQRHVSMGATPNLPLSPQKP